MTVRSRHTWRRGLLAPALSLAALPLAALFVCACHDAAAWPLLVWQLGTLSLVLLALRTRRFRDRPGAAAGLLGVPLWVLLMPVAPTPDGSTALLLGWFVSAFAVGAFAASIAERAEVMRETRLPSGGARALTALSALAALGMAAHLGTRAPEHPAMAPGAPGERIGSVEIPALPTVVRERFSAPGRREQIEVEVTSEPTPGGGALARVVLSRDDTDGVLAPRTEAPCLLDVPPMGRTIEVLAGEQTYGIRWPVSPHGESFGGCTYERTSLRPTDDPALSGAPVHHGWALVLGPLFSLLALGLAWPLRRRHARIDRSPEVRVSTPGIATMPDGSPAAVPAEIPMGSTIVALRIADVRPDYRSDARVSVEEHAAGEKPALLVDLARRVRTLELFALAATLFVLSAVLAAAMLGAPLAF